jgi:hypothetical protein
MAWTKSAWADVIGTDTTKITVSGGSSTTTGTVDCNGTNPYVTLAIKAVAIYGTTPDDSVLVEVLGVDADGANEDDTLALWSAEIPSVSTSEERATYQLNVSALDTVKVKVTNQDSTDTVDVWVSVMGGYA